ncbi:uncharacterized protein LOC126846708 [Adelges cooleyi]|uniref:uncharacterized protein LOC126846708 n=1 Tax=Adelges cooleyi TaxID=133065 RepID=UPI0021802E2D|nr:uncharacterized protein LOC126846708 [Adelges cooleyi]
MGENAKIMSLITLVLICLHGVTQVCARPPKGQSKMLNNIKKEENWEGMWFDEFREDWSWMPISYLRNTNSRVDTLFRLKLVSPLMGCAYGVDLNYYHLLTLVAIDECNEMQKNQAYALAEDCKSKLEDSIENGKIVILKLMHSLMLIDIEIGNDVVNDRFYQVLFPLKDFLEENPTVIEFNGILPGGLNIYTLFHKVAETLREFLIHSCKPTFTLFSIDTINRDYNSEYYPNGIYDYYLQVLNSYMIYIENHLTELGFYDKNTANMSYPKWQTTS